MDLSHVTNATGVVDASLGLPLQAATPSRPPIPVLNHKVVPEATAIEGEFSLKGGPAEPRCGSGTRGV